MSTGKHPYFHAQSTPNKPAYIMAKSGEVVTYSQLEKRSNQAAHLFRKLGLKIGDHVAIFMENNIYYLALCIAAQRSGLYFTCVSSHLKATEVEYIVKDCHAKLLITSHAMSSIASLLKDSLGNIHKLMALGTIDGHPSLEDALREMPDTPIADQAPGMFMLYSSGTTGKQKGVKKELPSGDFTDPSILVYLCEALFQFEPSMIYLSPAPLYHAAPLAYCLTVLSMGGTCIIMDHFDSETALSLIEKYKASHSQWVPTMFVRMLKLPAVARNKYDMSSMRVAIHAAAPCPIPIKDQMIEWWGEVIFEYYAGTEGNGFCAIASDEWLIHKGSVGKALFGELHILDESGQECRIGDIGTVYFANGQAFEYYNDPIKTEESRNAQGWTTLGDIGYVDDEEYLYLTDRKAFMIISGGVNIYPQECENLLVTHPKIADAAVIGVPNEEFGEEVKAVVQLLNFDDASPAMANELMSYCRANLSSIKCPRSIDFVGELPRLPNGKLYKRQVRDRYWGTQTA